MRLVSLQGQSRIHHTEFVVPITVRYNICDGRSLQITIHRDQIWVVLIQLFDSLRECGG